MWSRLRDRRLGGFKFRRQVPLGPYIADFMCEQAMLIVELDGAQHAEIGRELLDRDRTAYLEQMGYAVVRVWNVDVKRNMFGVLETLLDHVQRRCG